VEESVKERVEGSGDAALIRITLSLELGPPSVSLPGRWEQATSLVFRLSPWVAGRLRDEISRELDGLGV
jgi:hypothetical protein